MFITVQQLANKINSLERFTLDEIKQQEKTPVVFINCKKYPFIRQIIRLEKLYETRGRNTLKRFIGKRVLLAETGNGKPVARCYATISDCIRVDSKKDFDRYRKQTCIVKGSPFDWKHDTKQKYLYMLTDVVPVPGFVPEGIRHGRTWMECTIDD